MAAPTWAAAQTGNTDAGGAWSYVLTVTPIGYLIVLHVMQDGTSSSSAVTVTGTNVANLAGGSNFTALNGGVGYGVGATPSGYHYLFMGRSTSAVTACTVTGGNTGSDDIYFRSYTFQNVSAGLTLDTVIENINPGATLSTRATSTSVAPTNVTTRNVDRLAVGFIGVLDDIQGAELTAMAGETGGDWTYPTAAFSSGTGTDGTLALINAPMALPGLLTGGGDAITSEAWGVITFALIGTTAEYQPRSPDHPVDMR